MIHRNRALVRYFWFCPKLDDYDCSQCASAYQQDEAFVVNNTAHGPITTTFQSLFSVLSTWEPKGDLTLDISIYSPSDSEHWFKYLTFEPDTPSATAGMLVSGGTEPTISDRVCHNDPEHGWIAGFRHAAPPRSAIRKVFHSVMGEGPFDSDQLEHQWWDQLPSVSAVTSVFLRLQNRRRWKPRSLAHMLARFPRLQEFHYEPWREWDFMRRFTGEGFRYLFEAVTRFRSNFKRLIVFENFNQQYPAVMQRFQNGEDVLGCDSLRKPTPAVSRSVALASLKLEQLAASFIVDARHFFEIELSWEWPDPTLLVLTSKVLAPNEDPPEIGAVLQAAAAAAMKMPQLETMEIWNGRKGLAAVFKYQAFRDTRHAVLLWRGTWDLAIEPSMFQAWRAVMHQYGSRRFDLVQERLDEAAIKSHAMRMRFTT